MIYSIYRRLRKNKPAPVNTDIQTEEVKIPVGGITDDGTVYEKKVYPDGKDELLYKEVRINDPKEEKDPNS